MNALHAMGYYILTTSSQHPTSFWLDLPHHRHVFLSSLLLHWVLQWCNVSYSSWHAWAFGQRPRSRCLHDVQHPHWPSRGQRNQTLSHWLLDLIETPVFGAKFIVMKHIILRSWGDCDQTPHAGDVPLTGPSYINGDNKSQVTNSTRPESTLKKTCFFSITLRESVAMGESLITHICTGRRRWWRWRRWRRWRRRWRQRRRRQS